ncbi:Small heat shock protein HSP [Quillaja saponaria]|uniref:Small heat shock protein HSP n=1 Tax=Quillaja saponaria TaxID=32244 RepID=A0AAD7M4Z4_QUISA|nr:Small heat shock protein HSP [Quillaja saponaria]
MELDLGFKITKTRDDITSIADFHITKDQAGILFLSRETDTMFILTCHLKGYRKENVSIKINEDGTRISISGKKPVQEMVMRGWMMVKKEVEVKEFMNVFKIPDGVVLDRIKARYSEAESKLKIVMPKMVKGIRGVGIEEVKEEEVDNGRSEVSVADKIPDKVQEKIQEVCETSKIERMEETDGVLEKAKGGEPKETEIEANGINEEDRVNETIKEPKIENEEEDQQTVEEEVGKGGFAAEEFNKEEYIAEKLPQESEGTDLVLEEKVKYVTNEETEIVRELQEPERKRIDDVKQVAEALQEKHEREHKGASKEVAAIREVEPPKTICAHPEAASMEFEEVEPEKEIDKPQTKDQPPPTAEILSKETLELRDQNKEQDIPEARRVQELEEGGYQVHTPEDTEESAETVAEQLAKPKVLNPSSIQQSPLPEIEEKGRPDESVQSEHETVKESQIEEPNPSSQVSTQRNDIKDEKTQTSQPELPSDKRNLEAGQKANQQEETHRICYEIQEEPASEDVPGEQEGAESKSQELEEEKEGATRGKKKDLKKCKLYSPCVLAGSAFLVSLTVFVIHHIRNKKK